MTQINEQDLKYFTGCAITGLLANPVLMTPQMGKYRDGKGVSLESMAVECAIGILEQLEIAKFAIESGTVKVSDPVQVPSILTTVD